MPRTSVRYAYGEEAETLVLIPAGKAADAGERFTRRRMPSARPRMAVIFYGSEGLGLEGSPRWRRPARSLLAAHAAHRARQQWFDRRVAQRQHAGRVGIGLPPCPMTWPEMLGKR